MAPRQKTNTSAEGDQRILELWQDRPRTRRTAEDVLVFYGWLMERQPHLLPRCPRPYEYIRLLVERHIVASTDADRER